MHRHNTCISRSSTVSEVDAAVKWLRLIAAAESNPNLSGILNVQWRGGGGKQCLCASETVWSGVVLSCKCRSTHHFLMTVSSLDGPLGPMGYSGSLHSVQYNNVPLKQDLFSTNLILFVNLGIFQRTHNKTTSLCLSKNHTGPRR